MLGASGPRSRCGRWVANVLLPACLCALTACGGGGGGGDALPVTPPPVTPPPVTPPTPSSPPSLTAQPAEQRVQAPSAAVFRVNASGDSLAYQWQRSFDSGSTWEDIRGATTAEYRIDSTAVGMSGLSVRVIVRNAQGSINSSAANLVVDAAPVTQARLELLGGDIGGPGTLDGKGEAARFMSFGSLSIGADGNLYVPSGPTYSPIGENVSLLPSFRKVSADGGVSTVGLPPTTVVTGLRPSHPLHATIDASGALYFVAADGTVRRLTTAGNLEFIWSGPSIGRQLSGIAVDRLGNVYVSDGFDHVIWHIDPSRTVRLLAGQPGLQGEGNVDGPGDQARFSSVRGLATDADGSLYVTDTGNRAIRKITPGGNVSTLAGSSAAPGEADGTGTSARFVSPVALSLDSAGNIFVADESTGSIRKVTPAGDVTTVARSLSAPTAVALSNTGEIYVGESGKHRISRVATDGTVSVLAGRGAVAGSADGLSTDAGFNQPLGVSGDDSGVISVAERGNYLIRRIAGGRVTTVAGKAGESGFADGQGSVARFQFPDDVVAVRGQWIVADRSLAIRSVTPLGSVTTRAVNLSPPGASVGLPVVELSVDAAANLIVVVEGLTSLIPFAIDHFSVLHRTAPDGTFTHLAGTEPRTASVTNPSPFNVDGPGPQATFGPRLSTVADASGVVYVADPQNNTIRKVTPAGAVSTFAGTPPSYGGPYGDYADGRGNSARFNGPEGITIDGAGNLYVADTGNHVIRKIAPDGTVTTVLGDPARIGIRLGDNPSLISPRRISWLGGKRFAITAGNAVLLAILP